MDADEDDFPFFTKEGSDAIARHSEILYLNASIEDALRAAIDQAMRDAGFALVDNDPLGRLAVPANEWGATAYTRNGLVACHISGGWRVYAQGTGQFLANLPEEIGVVSRFVREAEQMMFWPMVEEIDAVLRERLQAVAHEAVKERSTRSRPIGSASRTGSSVHRSEPVTTELWANWPPHEPRRGR